MKSSKSSWSDSGSCFTLDNSGFHSSLQKRSATKETLLWPASEEKNLFLPVVYVPGFEGEFTFWRGSGPRPTISDQTLNYSKYNAVSFFFQRRRMAQPTPTSKHLARDECNRGNFVFDHGHRSAASKQITYNLSS